MTPTYIVKHLRHLYQPVILFALFFSLVSWFCTKNAPLDPQQTQLQDDIVIFVGITSSPNVVGPGGRSIIRALLMDENNRPVADEEIEFSVDRGLLSLSRAATNDSGFAIVTFTAPQQSGSATVTATYNSVVHKAEIEINNSTPQSVGVLDHNVDMLADGLSTLRIGTIWRKDDGSPLTGITVNFEASIGHVTPFAVTGSTGEAWAEYTSIASRMDVIAEITAAYDSLSIPVQVLLKGVDFSITTSHVALIADGRSQSRIRAILKEATSHIAISGAVIQFGADLGTITNQTTTTSEGIADVDLTSTMETGISTVTAVFGNMLTDTVRVVFGQSVPTNLNLSADPAVIPADNHSVSLLTAVITDAANNPVPDGTPVSFEIVEGSGTIESNRVTSQGVAVSSLVSGTQPDQVTIVARVNQLTDTTYVRYVVGEAEQITITADSTSLPADGTTSTIVTANVFDSAGNPVLDGTRVSFETDIGDITESAQTVNGTATAQFSSNTTGIATITARAGLAAESINIQLRPGPPNSILLTYDPTTLGVKDSGRNQTVTVTAYVVDSQNNAALDGTLVTFSIFQSPGGGEVLSNDEPIPTLNGAAQVSLNSGIRSGSVRIMAEVTDETGTPIPPGVRAVSTDVIIFAGPPYIENVNVSGTSHLSVGVAPLNIRGWDWVNNTAAVTALVGDKYNNPVPPGTAVYFTTTGGVISTYQGFTDAEGVATVTIHSGNPLPDITRFYSTEHVSYDPNDDHADWSLPTNVIPGPIPDFDLSEVINSLGGLDENDGITRILAITEGVDANGNAARAWSVTSLVFSGAITTFDMSVDKTDLSPGESALVLFTIYDINGNPIVGDSEIIASCSAGAAQLSWSAVVTDDPGITHYSVTVSNGVDPTDPDAKASTAPVTITVKSDNGNVINSTVPINFNLN